MEIILTATVEMNELWSSVHMQERIYWGHDAELKEQQPTPATDGLDMKVVLRHEALLLKSFDIMLPVWALLEAKGLLPENACASSARPRRWRPPLATRNQG